jgi:hypothetical protein
VATSRERHCRWHGQEVDDRSDREARAWEAMREQAMTMAQRRPRESTTEGPNDGDRADGEWR